jgi:multicomponent Na+:H+ antiporter subunit F
MNYILYGLIMFLIGSLYRLVFGPSIEDRILAINVVAVIVILIICLYSIYYERSYYLDIALVYALLSFGEVLAFAKFTLPEPLAGEDQSKNTERPSLRDLEEMG